MALVPKNATAGGPLDQRPITQGGMPGKGADDVWGPLALSEGKLVMRDFGKMVCIDMKQGG